MSRALDSRVKKALQDGDHEQVYAQISSALIQRCDNLLEIEFLGQSHQLEPHISFWQDDHAIAIPKIRLIQAFIVARKKLKDYSSEHPNILAREALNATAVMLLMDAEHLTAANTRKRILEKEVATSGQEAAESLLQEKYFIDSLLTSRLHRHTKSPNLWSHRRWLVDRFRTLGLLVDVAEDLRRVVFVSGERHPRNYYAWCHARHLIDSAGVDSSILCTAMEDTKKWCFTHHNDVSGWMFMLFLLGKSRTRTEEIFRETINLAESFHWRNESVWYFLRNLALSESMNAKVSDDYSRVFKSLRVGANQDDGRNLDKTAVWFEKHSSELFLQR